MSPPGRTEDRAWRELLDAACAPYRAAGHFAWHFARGKLARDPVFRHVLKHGLIAPGSRVLDIGCGQGLLARLLCTAAGTPLPPGWAAAPAHLTITGIELRARDVALARAALADAGSSVQVLCGDLRCIDFPPADTVVLFDVLHYLPDADQQRVLERARAALSPAGRLLLRVGDASAGWHYAFSQWVDRVVRLLRGQGMAPTTGHALSAWMARLQGLGFQVRPEAMSQGTPFANVLLIADCQGTAA